MKTKRQTVQMVPIQDGNKQKYRPQGTESADHKRANLFGVWEDLQAHEYGGRYVCAGPSDSIGVEIEVRFAFFEGDTNDHAEVYTFEVFRWARKGRKLLCESQISGDWVAESGDIEGPFSIYGPLITAGAQRIRNARCNKTPFETRTIGPKLSK